MFFGAILPVFVFCIENGQVSRVLACFRQENRENISGNIVKSEYEVVFDVSRRVATRSGDIRLKCDPNGYNVCLRFPMPGYGDLDVSFRITAGDLAKPNAFPYMVGLMRKKIHYCGGSILTNKWILTAAHCCFSRSKEIPNGELTISIGSVFLPTSTQHPVARKIYHENFNISSPYDNDIALFKSKTIFALGDLATKVRLAVTSKASDLYGNCTVAGWGFVKIKNMIVKNPTGRLNFVDIDTVPRSKCLNAYGKRYIAKDVLCVAGISGKGTCSADSGAPLVCNSKQVGILSFGGECTNTAPEVYTKVSHYISWIKKYVEDNKA